MELLLEIKGEVLKQKDEEAHNVFSRVADVREFISVAQPSADLTVTLKLGCLSSERLHNGRGTRVIAIDAIQRTEFEATANALADLTPLKRKQFIASLTVWDAKPKNGSFGKPNIGFRPGGVYTFRNVDGVGYYADIAKGSVAFERGVNTKVFEFEPPMKKRKPTPASKKGGISKLQKHRGEDLPEYDIEMEEGINSGAAVTTRSKSVEQQP
ncbi:hypothetical protein V7S43_007623 [Phytophthora oleae]|uniref:Uncharacterized protein n=1 Tax=Phytophthora oleae TaxID=2107226 RepID=A0ABD3FKG5_9STRA